jgi:hypothetical protein
MSAATFQNTWTGLLGPNSNALHEQAISLKLRRSLTMVHDGTSQACQPTECNVESHFSDITRPRFFILVSWLPSRGDWMPNQGALRV